MCVCVIANKFSSQLTLSGVSKLIPRPVSRTTRNIWCFHPGETRTHENLDFIVSISFTDLVIHEARLVSWWRLSLGILGKRDLTDWHVLNCEGTGSQRQPRVSTSSRNSVRDLHGSLACIARFATRGLHAIPLSASRLSRIAIHELHALDSRLSIPDSRKVTRLIPNLVFVSPYLLSFRLAYGRTSLAFEPYPYQR